MFCLLCWKGWCSSFVLLVVVNAQLIRLHLLFQSLHLRCRGRLIPIPWTGLLRGRRRGVEMKNPVCVSSGTIHDDRE